MLKTLALLLLSMVFIISATFAVAGLDLQTLLYPEAYQNVLEKGGVYSRALQQLHLPENVISVDDIKPIVNEIMGRVFAYIRSETNQLNLTLSMQSDIVRNAILAKLSALPTCLAGQMPLKGSAVVCKPAGVSNEKLISLLDIPPLDLSPMFGDELQKVRDVIATFRSALLYSIIVAIACIGVIIFIAKSRAAKWIGVNLIIVGLIGISFSLVKDIIPSVVGNSPVLPIVQEIIPVVIDKIVLYGLIFLAAGIVLLILSFRLKPKK